MHANRGVPFVYYLDAFHQILIFVVEPLCTKNQLSYLSVDLCFNFYKHIYLSCMFLIVLSIHQKYSRSILKDFTNVHLPSVL